MSVSQKYKDVRQTLISYNSMFDISNALNGDSNKYHKKMNLNFVSDENYYLAVLSIRYSFGNKNDPCDLRQYNRQVIPDCMTFYFYKNQDKIDIECKIKADSSQEVKNFLLNNLYRKLYKYHIKNVITKEQLYDWVYAYSHRIIVELDSNYDYSQQVLYTMDIINRWNDSVFDKLRNKYYNERKDTK